jgi:hypothetical protein
MFRGSGKEDWQQLIQVTLLLIIVLPRYLFSINYLNHILENEEVFFFFFKLHIIELIAGNDLFYVTRWDPSAQQLYIRVGCYADCL